MNQRVRSPKPPKPLKGPAHRTVSSGGASRSLANASEPLARRALKVPEALPTDKVKESTLDKIKSAVFRKKTTIQAIVREPTSGGIVFRFTKDKKDIEILLIQDSKGRWTIPKGHIEPGETAKMTARREIEEETGLKNVSVLTWLGKIHFKYRRLDKLVLMTTQIYLVQALDSHEMPTPEKWMKGIKWFSFAEALDMIEYEDIGKLMLVAKKKIRAGDY
ncbi:NUDIX domain-containing protein [Candidatus Saccharibacteria bacterium]|nr:NUDIX domain-containing protein [Candidatus Saccharibacteria bacterium]